MSQLSADCLNEIFEYFEDDAVNLRSYLFVNRLWCEVSVRILWRSIRNYNTLIACLPTESKEILSKIGIITSTLAASTFKDPSFCKVLSVDEVYRKVVKFLKNQQPTSNNHNECIVTQEIFKLLMSQMSSLKKLKWSWIYNFPKFTSFPGADNCLKDLTELHCRSNTDSEIFYQLSHIC